MLLRVRSQLQVGHPAVHRVGGLPVGVHRVNPCRDRSQIVGHYHPQSLQEGAHQSVGVGRCSSGSCSGQDHDVEWADQLRMY